MDTQSKKTLSIAATCLLAGFGLGALAQRSWDFPFPAAEGRGPVESPMPASPGGDGAADTLPGGGPFDGEAPVFGGMPRGDAFVADRLCGHVRRPGHQQRHSWPEHPKKRVVMRANNFGFREDEDTSLQVAEGTYRILVTGDSHTDGLVFNKESFANRLERMLNARKEFAPTEVINGGVGHYGPHNYLGFLKKHLGLRPDMFVVILFGGNDFLDTVRIASLRGGIDVPSRTAEYGNMIMAAEKACRPAVAQGLNQALFFKTYPRLEGPTVSAAAQQLLAIQKICAAEGIEFVFVVLPTKMDVDWKREPPDVKAPLQRILGLDEADLGINRRMMVDLVQRLEKRQIACLDLLRPLRRNKAKLYWNRDHHLNVTGQTVAARAFFAKYADKIPRK